MSRDQQDLDLDERMVSAATLARLLQVTERRVFQHVEDGLFPKAQASRYPLVQCLQARMRYLEGLASGRAETDLDVERKRAQIDLLREQQRKTSADERRITLAVQTAMLELLPATQVRRVMAEVLRVLTNGLDGLPDRLEHKLALAPEVLQAIDSEVNRWREALHTKATEAFGEEPSASEAT